MTRITFIMFLAAIFGGIPIVAKSPECLIISRALVGLHCGKNLEYMDKLSTEAALSYYFLRAPHSPPFPLVHGGQVFATTPKLSQKWLHFVKCLKT